MRESRRWLRVKSRGADGKPTTESSKETGKAGSSKSPSPVANLMVAGACNQLNLLVGRNQFGSACVQRVRVGFEPVAQAHSRQLVHSIRSEKRQKHQIRSSRVRAGYTTFRALQRVSRRGQTSYDPCARNWGRSGASENESRSGVAEAS